ncbi:MAG: hypothetical protein WC242_05130 [Candidatus Paceibacterota bacterium]|jgi:hypothetical protein
MIKPKDRYKFTYELFLIFLLFSFLVGFYFLIIPCKNKKIVILDKKNKPNEFLSKISTNHEQNKTILFASINGKLYYRADCQSLNKINSENTIWFLNKQEAIDSGYQYRPTKNCPAL